MQRMDLEVAHTLAMEEVYFFFKHTPFLLSGGKLGFFRMHVSFKINKIPVEEKIQQKLHQAFKTGERKRSFNRTTKPNQNKKHLLQRMCTRIFYCITHT